MSMVLYWVPTSASKIADLLETPEGIEDFLEQADLEEVGDLDKAWHGLHWLLTGTSDGGEPPLCYLVLGGKEVGDIEVGYGTARAFSPDEVVNWHHALSALSEDHLRANFKPAEMDAAELYPQGWSADPEENWEYLLDGFEKLKSGVSEATKTGSGLIVWLS